MAVPTYDRGALTPAVVHMSVGYFHRSHQALYFDDLARLGVRDWGITGVGLRRRRMRDALRPQDCLYTVVERSAEADRARVVGVMNRYLFAPGEGRAVVDALADERTRLVTLTITAAGYHADPTTGAFDANAAELVADLVDPARPRSALGLLVAGLDARRRAGRPPFTVLSCDNLTDNGDATRLAVVSFARLRDERLARWVEEHVAFPSSMVDRITPKTTEADRRWLARKFGVLDRWPVITEPFSDWVVEDAFCHGRPPLDEVGVSFVADVRPYALIKTRLLNAVHFALGVLGGLAGHLRTDAALADPMFRAFVERLMAVEIAPLLPRVPGSDLNAYQRAIVERLANPKIGDQLARLCRHGSLKLPRHVLPTILAARAEGRPHPLLTLAVAAWCRHLRGFDDEGRPLTIEDVAADRLQLRATMARTDPRPLLAETAVFGELAGDEDFVLALERVLETLECDGARAALAAALAPPDLVAA